MIHDPDESSNDYRKTRFSWDIISIDLVSSTVKHVLVKNILTKIQNLRLLPEIYSVYLKKIFWIHPYLRVMTQNFIRDWFDCESPIIFFVFTLKELSSAIRKSKKIDMFLKAAHSTLKAELRCEKSMLKLDQICLAISLSNIHIQLNSHFLSPFLRFSEAILFLCRTTIVIWGRMLLDIDLVVTYKHSMC